MDNLNINQILNRHESELKIKEILQNFELNKNNLSSKKGIYVYGEPGTGKTNFVMNILKDLNYDVIKYDAGDIRNKSIIDTITKHNMSDKNIMSMFHKKIQRIAFVMDEIDGMNNGDKGGINTLIKLIRPKKTKKQKLEEVSFCPIICIGNYHIDKKIKELIKVCNTIELKIPNCEQMKNIINVMMPELDENIKVLIRQYVQSDLRKVSSIFQLYKNDKNLLNENIIKNIFQVKYYNDDTKKITQKIINSNYSIDDHLTVMNDTDRTIVGLLWHENIIDVLGKYKKNISIPFYLKILDNMCFADYIDRTTFQKQIWQFNEMSSLIKTFKNNKLYNETFSKKQKFNPVEVRFTKVLTKYSTEYNNSIFIQNFCQQLNMDKKDVFFFFLDLKNKYDDNEIINLFENYEISKLDINRMYRYLEKYTKEDCPENDLLEDDDTDIGSV
ncbi:MAG: AAA family ATPase [Proteobacteria bacterium]|nr:AAA family ATPase [Pseudomonadota bacterium]